MRVMKLFGELLIAADNNSFEIHLAELVSQNLYFS